jgi:alcohol dehydrogenase class IV
MSTLDTTNHECSNIHGFYGWTNTLKGVQYGPGCVETALPKFLDLLGVKKALIVTGRSLFEKVSVDFIHSVDEVLIAIQRQTEVVKQVEAVLRHCNAYGGVFYEIGQHAPIAGIRKGQQAFKDAGCDVIVSVGGGSPIDAAKAILYNLQQETGGPVLKQIAIPTTLSAAEYTVRFTYLL